MTSSARKGRGARQRPAEADGTQVINGISVTGSDVRQLAPADARDSVIPHMSRRARPALSLPGPDQPVGSGSPSSGAKGPRRRRSDQCLYALMGCLSERSRSQSTGPYQSAGTPRTRRGSSSCLADGSAPRGIPNTLFRSSRSLAIGQPPWCRAGLALAWAYAHSMTRPRVSDKRTDPVTGERQRFSSAILPAWARKTPKITEVLPLLYLHGLSSGTSCLRSASSSGQRPGCQRR